MAFNLPPRKTQYGNSSPPRISPLRNSSHASTNSSAYSAYSNSLVPSRTSTVSSSASSNHYNLAGQKRGLAEAGMTSGHRHSNSAESSPSSTYKTMRQSLRPLPQPPNNFPAPPPSNKVNHQYQFEPRNVQKHLLEQDRGFSPSPTPDSIYSSHGHSRSLSAPRDDSNAPSFSISRGPESNGDNAGSVPSVLAHSDLGELKKSSTSHLQTLSRLTQGSSGEDFSISSPGSSVAGLQYRRQLKRTDSTRVTNKNKSTLNGGAASGWSVRNWMDQQRQYIQAYEYLCHIGEAKEWIENVIHKPIPPIVQLEQALRDGITLAEIVQALKPNQHVRIFHHPKLQFRHSDNIAIFFRFLDEVELADTFRFELIDLYEKKNIPKVIHCIHALSWVLYGNGMVEFRIGNLVGRLEFERHELEETQKGLDKAGINMPSFSGMGASFGAEPEPEPEPMESEEERIDRELNENEGSILDLQTQMRGCLNRLKLGQMMQGLWDAEDVLVGLQSQIRGNFARQIFVFRRDMSRSVIRLQDAARGFIVRARQKKKETYWKSQEPAVTLLQSLVRASRAREQTQHLRTTMRREDSGIRKFQAAIRGALERKRFDDQYEAALHCEVGLQTLQAAVRGMLERHRYQHQASQLRQSQRSVTTLQSALRGMIARSHRTTTEQALREMNGRWIALSAVSRGSITRNNVEQTRTELGRNKPMIGMLQAYVRSGATRQAIKQDQAALAATSSSTAILQGAARGLILRSRQAADLRSLWSNVSTITQLQAFCRGVLFRTKHSRMLEELGSNTPEIIQMQTFARAMLLRIDIGSLLSHLDYEEMAIEALQAAARGMLVRAEFAEKQRFFKENMEKVVKVQSFVRAKIQGQAYKSLTSGKNPPVGTVKGFVHLLNDSDFDFDEEVEFERLRKTVVQHVRQNEMADQYITQLDIKIALLVKNKITLDEVVKHQKHFGGSVGGLMTRSEMSSKDPFDLKALNKNSRRQLERYQEMFFLLQTQPQYLARMFKKIRERALPEKECERTKHLMMGLFGYAQKRREEYYLIKLITRSIKEEIDSCHSLQDYLRGSFFWAKIFGAYTKSPRDRKYMRDLLGPIVRENIIDNAELDLESDPLQIYHGAIHNEQLRTGQRSQRKPDVSREEAIRDPETKRLFISHLQDLRDVADQFFAALEDLLHRMPYGVRYIAQQMFDHLTTKFQHEEKGHLLQVVGHWIWKGYLQPALLEPERFGAVDRGLAAEHKKNLGEVAKVIGQVSAAKLFGAENMFLQPLNSYVTESIERLTEIWGLLIDVPDAETQFDIDEFNDLYAKTKPTLYIKMTDIFSIHHLVATDIGYISPSQEEMLRDVVRELGSVKHNEHELMGVSTSEICLTLSPKLHDVEDPDAEVKALFMETKRCVLYIIRVQSGANLMEIMLKAITRDDDSRWRTLVRDELSATSRKRGAYYAEANTLIDLASMTYAELKRTALENILRLEQAGRLSRHNHYQDLLNAIAVDIRTKHRRRVQRQRELEGVRLTLARLDDQAVYLDGQLKTYNDYIEQAMVTLQNKKGKKRFLLPFTKQWNHERELQLSGRVPKFGSFKYSAQELANRGILVMWQGYSDRQWGSLDLTVSSNEVGVFVIEGSSGSIAIPGASAQVSLDDLLQAQYNGTQFLEFFGEGEKVRVGVNLFLHLIMRKFYKDRDS